MRNRARTSRANGGGVESQRRSAPESATSHVIAIHVAVAASVTAVVRQAREEVSPARRFASHTPHDSAPASRTGSRTNVRTSGSE